MNNAPPYVTEQTVNTAIMAFQVITLAVLGIVSAWVKSAQRNAKEAKEQTSNDHNVNLRDDIDEKHDFQNNVLLSLDAKVDGVIDSQREIKKTLDTHSKRLSIVENDGPLRKVRKWLRMK